MKYSIHFDFDCEGEPPKVFIVEDGEGAIVEVLEEPELLTPEFSWEVHDWRPGKLAQALLASLLWLDAVGNEVRDEPTA